ncbi:MAG: cofactor-independent phosphoglycerate mutase [Magnetococcales bacterium]|nr:cofactor-independent phosphoglycerate mutase [Magnetococcales bacterium]
MSDQPIRELDGKTPLMAAHTPNLDRMVRDGVGGWSRNTPPGFHPGSDVANLGVLGYDVTQGYTGRSPLEAAAMGVTLSPTDVAFRCNLVTLSDDYRIMGDFSAGHISTPEASEIIKTLDQELGSELFRFHPGVSYRHLLVWNGGGQELRCAPPHDISDRPIEGHLPTGPDSDPIRELMIRSRDILADHPVNRKREAEGQLPANSIWLWGHGKKPGLTPFTERFGKQGGMISAVDLMRGIAVHIGFENIHVPGATGWIDTDYGGKAQACIDGLNRNDLIFIHVESPDEAGHAGRLDYKLQAIEDFDAKVVGPVLAHLVERGPFRAISLPDHPTPIATKTHNPDPVPFALYGTGISPDSNQTYDEGLIETASLTFDPGSRMMAYLLDL